MRKGRMPFFLPEVKAGELCAFGVKPRAMTRCRIQIATAEPGLQWFCGRTGYQIL